MSVLDDGAVRVTVGETARHFRFSELRINSRVGNTPRAIRFPNGALFESDDNDGVDAALARFRPQPWARRLHGLETHVGVAVISAVGIAVFSWAAIQFGAPMLAKRAAFALPAKTSGLIGQGALDLLDRSFLAPTELGADTQERLRAEFERMTSSNPGGMTYKLEFRLGRRVGANALALPSGTVVLTDELVKLAQDEREVLAVLAHEVGHVVHRHALRRIIQDSIVSLLLFGLTGEVSSVSTLIAALPVMLVEAGYSQAFEREADAYALEFLKAHELDPLHFKNLLSRLDPRKDSGGPAKYFSTHPPAAERVEIAERTADGRK